MRAREIKDLSIACEALSRIPGGTAESLQSRIYDQLIDLLREAETQSNPKNRKHQTELGEEIPF